MKPAVRGWYGLGVAALLLGLIGFGVPVWSALLVTVLLACLMMMLSMWAGGHGHQHGGDEPGGHVGQDAGHGGRAADQNPQDTPWGADGDRPRTLR